MGAKLLRSAGAAARIGRARQWLVSRAAGEEVLVLAASARAASELLRSAALERGAGFGWHRATLSSLARELATPALVERQLAPVGGLAAEAVVARVVDRLRERDRLGRYAAVANGPGLARALLRSLQELRFARVDRVELAAVDPELAALADAYGAGLAEAGLADRAAVYELAVEVGADASVRHPWLGLPSLLLDVPVETELEAALLGALVRRAPELLATLPRGDEASEQRLVELLGAEPECLDGAAAGSLERLQRHVFESAPAPAEADDRVVVLSAPGESRECVEIARRALHLAESGVPFDRMAVLLRSVEEYRAHLEEAFGRAGVPLLFERGALRPEPAGRAFASLLACAAENLSARRFAEYLSLGELPDATPDGAPPPSLTAAERWVAPDEELVTAAVAEALGERLVPESTASTDPEERSVREGSLRAPRRWEALLVDAAVIGGSERWQQRLDGLARQLELDLAELEDPESAKAEALRRACRDLASLRDYALPLIADLVALPRRATWGRWLDALAALATRGLRRPERVLAVLAELAPMAGVGEVDLAEVRAVLTPRLVAAAAPPPRRRAGQGYAGPAETARGLAFDVVFVPGLAERLFPRRIEEDPILLDETRRRLHPALPTRPQRVAHERRILRLAVGAAGSQLVLSYPRLDLDQGRPRVPSFYGLEVLRAVEGRLPGFDELQRRAERVGDARVGWPAPRRPTDAIDQAEHDLALLDGLLDRDEEKSVGTARYLLGANPHLGRALRFRGRRWRGGWTVADGIVRPSAAARRALRRHALAERSYSPTALQHYAACPYRFFLQAVLRLAPREVPVALEDVDPLTRGSLVHDVQFRLLTRLREEGLLPVRAENLARARELLDEILTREAERYRDDLAPAIERVWLDAVDSIQADLREWLRRASLDESGFVPWRFELAFGLSGRRERDARSTREAVRLACGLRLRGSVDLVERRDGGTLRVTDHKTGKSRVSPGAVIAGGEALQPVLYALAAEQLEPGARVESGRLYYCTSAGGFDEVSVPLDDAARRSAEVLAATVGRALEEPFLPAAPARGACRFCDYVSVCGPSEETRTARKSPRELAPLRALRELP